MKLLEILRQGESTASSGSTNWAFRREAALQAIDQFLKESIPILGGDVLEKKNENWSSTYDNWSIEIKEGESIRAYAERSAIETRKYIESYWEGEDNIYYTFVPEGFAEVANAFKEERLSELSHKVAQLLAEWNPISVPEHIAYSEYQSYAEPLLTECETEIDVRNYLTGVFTKFMGFDLTEQAIVDIQELSSRIFNVHTK